MQKSGSRNLGLSTADALKKLADEIAEVLKIYENKKDTKFKSQYEILQNYSIFITILVIFGLIYTMYYGTAFFVFLILVLNIAFVKREDELKRTELIRKCKLVLEDIQLATYLSKDWQDHNYPHLFSPLSPCISLVWTYRDNRLVNLPTALLVEGDIILLRLGSNSPGLCRETDSLRPRTFKLGDSYGLNATSEPPSKPIAVQPLPDLVCEMLETPFLENLRLSLENFLTRPQTIHDRLRHILINHYMQKYIFFLTITVTLCTIILRAFNRYYIVGKVKHTTWDHVAVRNIVSTWISLLPLIFPLIWINLHHWGTAKLETLMEIPQPLMMADKSSKGSSEIMDTPTSGELDLPKIPRKQIWMNFLRIVLNGSCETLSRSTNIIQVLGSISAFCCVDKKGILSWPNPTPEKVFFLRDTMHEVKSDNDGGSESSNFSEHANGGFEATAEVLDLTHDQNSPFKLEFDDHEWKVHLSSLKPLGEFAYCLCDLYLFAYSN